jgi:DNA-binding MarR family transcriptional regulator
MLDESVLSPSEISEQLGVPIGNVSYHVRQLDQLGLIKLVRETPRRGAIEHHYTAEARPLITDAAWREAPEIVRRAMVGAALEESAKAVNSAALTGGFSRDGALVGRIPTPLDKQGWKEVSKELNASMARVQKLAEASQKRLKKNDHDGESHATALLMFFEDAAVTEQQPSRTRKRTQRGRSVRNVTE